MGKIVVTEFVSLDGVFEDPGGAEGYEHGGWTFTFDQGEEGPKFKLDELMASDAQLLGRVTYEGFAKAWPAMKDPVGFADKMNGMPKYVVSSTLTNPSWNNTTVITVDEVNKLKDQYQGDILIAGSGHLVRALTVNRSNGIPLTIWYCWQEPVLPWNSFGLLDVHGRAKAAYQALQSLRAR